MNLGLSCATGEYIGIIETDDWTEPDMFLTLYRLAKEEDLDVVKSSFWFFYSIPKEKNISFHLPARFVRMSAFNPTEDLKEPLDMVDFFNIKPSIWSAIYRRAFLEENNIRFNETPGASYQDAGFNFKIWVCAERVKVIPEAFLHYRQDNEQSSVNSPSKVMCVCDEYQEIRRFIEEKYSGEKKELLLALMERLKLDSYAWNYERLAVPLNKDFARAASEELKADMKNGFVRKEFFSAFKWENYNLWINDAEAFAREMDRTKNLSLAGKAVGKLKRMLKRG